MSKDIKLEFVVIGSGDSSVGIRSSFEEVTVIFHEQDETTLDIEAMTSALKEFLCEQMENCGTRVFTKQEHDAQMAEDDEADRQWSDMMKEGEKNGT